MIGREGGVRTAVQDVSVDWLHPGRTASDTWRIRFSGEVPMHADGGDEVVRPGARVRGDDQSRILLVAGQRAVNAAGPQQLLALTEREDRLAVAVLILDELQRPSIGAKGGDR